MDVTSHHSDVTDAGEADNKNQNQTEVITSLPTANGKLPHQSAGETINSVHLNFLCDFFYFMTSNDLMTSRKLLTVRTFKLSLTSLAVSTSGSTSC